MEKDNIELFQKEKQQTQQTQQNIQNDEPTANKIARFIGDLAPIAWFMTLGCCFKPYIDIPDYKRAVIYEFGKYKCTYQSGTHKYNRITEKYNIVDEIIIGEYHKGIFIRDNKFIEILEPGIHFSNPAINEQIILINATIIGEFQKGVLIRNGVFVQVLEPGIYYANTFLKEEIKIIDLVTIREMHKGIKLKDGKFVQVLEPGMWFANTFLTEKIEEVPEIVIEENQKGLKIIDGQYKETLNPGRYFANPYLKEKIIPVNMQILTKELVPQTIVTKDTTSFVIKGILVYRIIDAFKAICQVENIDFAIREQIKSITQQVLSEHDLDYIMANKLALSGDIRDRVKDKCNTWGIEVIAIDIKELNLPQELQSELCEAARAKRIAESMLIRGEAEVKNAEMQKQVAEMLASPAATHMREMETIQNICKNQNTKMTFIAHSVRDLLGDKTLSHIVEKNN
jgi:regulator of protease activity HflC (stomatin/prohibitin superfamily)